MSLGVLVVPVFLVLSSSSTVSTGRPAAQNVPRVCIEEGCLRGTWMRSVQGERFQAFIGIPYAKPPIGELRFADPVPNSRWEEDELDTSGRFPRAPCLQHNLFLPGRGVEGKEDCLYLNVYRSDKSRKDIDSNNNTTSTTLPTIVYIHGGGYMAGYTSPLVSGAEKLMDHSVILVTVAYRLGAFGFLSTGDEAASGNFGLKDQRLALRWVSRNIQAFGGDPRLVTIMGQSAGGASVQLHMMHLGNEGLFQRAISLSGSALSAWSTPRPDTERLARHQAALVGVEGADTMSTSELVQALRAVDADLFVRNFAGFTNGSRYPMIVYGPTVEKATVKDAFLTETPLKLWSQGAILHTPWLTGTLPNDGFVFSAPILRESDCSKDTLSQQQALLLNVLRGAHNSNAFPLLHERFFANATSVGKCFTKENIHILTKIFNEAFFVYPMTLSVQQYLHHKTKASTSGAPVYLYQFNYQGQNSYSSIFVNEEDESATRNFGIVHCDELLYIFRAPVLFPDFQRGSPDAKVSHRFTKFLVDFARTGTVDERMEDSETDTLNDAKFPPALELYNKESQQDPLGMRRSTIDDREMFDFWTRFYGS